MSLCRPISADSAPRSATRKRYIARKPSTIAATWPSAATVAPPITGWLLIAVTGTVPATVDLTERTEDGFGQGKVTATPLQMAMVSAGLANDGVVMNPRMVDAVIGNDLSVIKAFQDSEFGRAMEADVANNVTAAMVASVATGAAQGARIDGIDVAGKTGTAENGNRPHTLWFTGFAPANDPAVAVAVVVEDGGGQGQSGSGDTIAAPIAKKVIEAVLGR